ncbi:hypothetical protein GOP47_0018430 [Adiantum capillus-veneris]|uniref:Cytochrome P450 n=1 Tax=Adiantum capillus-veneris TaxID=13818 RepID=A0A9D4UEN1_ADICA|nr:hypothetical protein GOP47_0018430 [Adiantum capillus-veneris]
MDACSGWAWWWQLVITAVLFAVLGTKWWASGKVEMKKMAPGPRGWPLAGHLLSLGSAQLTLSQLEKRYGPILTLWLGRVPSIAISGAKETREALLECGAALASRPRLRSRAILTGNYCIMNTSPYGPYWRSLRRALVSVVLGPSNLNKLSPVRKGIFDSFISWLLGEASQNEGVVPVSAPSRLAIFRILAYMCVGRHLDESTLDVLDEIAKQTLILQGLLKGDFIPLLGLFEGKKVKTRQDYKKKQEEFWGPLIEENREIMLTDNTSTARVGCYMHTLLSTKFEEDAQSVDGYGCRKLGNCEISALCTEFMNAGTDTTAACVEWAMANLIYHPEIQERVFQEIHEHAGDRPLCEADLEGLPYLRAVIKETLRRHPSAHFTFLHTPTNGPCKVGGYDVPENAMVSFHLASVLRDPNVWEEPMEFKPERFLDVEIDLTGWKKSNAVPFGLGRRICPGAKLALLHANLLVGRLVQNFQWSPAKDGSLMDLGERNAGVVAMKNPLFARIAKRRSRSTTSAALFS